MEALEVVTDNPNEILKQIWHQNLSLRESLPNYQDNEKAEEYLQKLTHLLLDLIKVINQQLEHSAKILQNTCQLLSVSQRKDWQQDSHQGESGIADWLLELCKCVLYTLNCLGETQSKLLRMSGRKSDHHEPQISVCDAKKEKENDASLLVSTSQPLLERLPKDDEEENTLVVENEVAGIESAVSLSDQESDKEQEFPMHMKNKDQNKLGNSNTVSDNGSRKGSDTELSLISEKVDLGDILENNGKNVIVSQMLGNDSIKHPQTLSNQGKGAEIKEALKQGENGNLWVIAEPDKTNKDVNQNEKNNEIPQSNQESGARSEDSHKNNSVPLSTGKLEKDDNESGWVNKEFLVEVSGVSEPELACCITGPASIVGNLVIRIANDMSPLLIDESEELVSNVIFAESSLPIEQTLASPICVAIPYNSCYRGMYKEVMVKISAVNFESCYVTPLSLEGHQRNYKGTFAEVKTCQLGLFSVVSCLKSETLTIPRKGCSRKLSMDPRISLCCPPWTFNSRNTIHLKVQPIEPSVISMLKVKHDAYHSVASTSPLVHLHHPSSQPFNKSVTVILPCPPNQDKKREGDQAEHGRVTSASIPRPPSVHHFRMMRASSGKHGEKLNESLKLLGYRSKEEGWALLDNITVRSARNGLVSFELNEPLKSFVVIRLSSPMNHAHLVQFIQSIEEAIHNIMVKVVIYRKKDDPYKITVSLVPSKELNLELQSLHEEGFTGPPESSQQFKMREGEQVYFRFSGNIFASDDGVTFGKTYKLTFHAQRIPRLDLQIKEVDEFGNYSSTHYKGTILFYKVSKETIAKNVENLLSSSDLEHQTLLCKLSLTLPKKERLIVRPQSTKRILIDSSEVLWDNLLYWLSEELSEENASCLALLLPLHRSTLQLIKLKCPDNLSDQIYELLCFWKRNLPRSADKLQLLTYYLCKSGRRDLAEDLQFKWRTQGL